MERDIPIRCTRKKPYLFCNYKETKTKWEPMNVGGTIAEVKRGKNDSLLVLPKSYQWKRQLAPLSQPFMSL